MSRQSIHQIQKPTNSTAPAANGILQRKKISRNNFDSSVVHIQSQSGPRVGGVLNSGSSFDFSKVPIQAKLNIGQPNDKYEQEADRVAEQIIRMSDPELSSSVGDSSLVNNTIPHSGTIRRACASCSEQNNTAEDESRPTREDELQQTKQITPIVQRQESFEEKEGVIPVEEEKEFVQAKITPGFRRGISSGVQSRIESLRGGGHPLPFSVSKFFQPRFGYDFSQVRIHSDSDATKTARSIQARAFTIGSDIVFDSKEYDPETIHGKKLLAHELTHVVQQGKGKPNPVQRKHKFPTIKPSLANQPIVNRMNIAQVGVAPILDCGAYRYRWNLELDNSAPCEGYMVQRVRFMNTIDDCSKPEVSSLATDPKIEYWESWRFNAGDTLDVDHASFGYSDQFSDIPEQNKTGLRAETGKAKFFCKSTTGDLDSLWTPNQYTVTLPATWSEPPWWNNNAIDSGFHWASSWWNCCGDKGEWWNKVDANP